VSERVTTLAAEIGDIVALSFAVIIISSTWDDASCNYGGGNSVRSFSGVEWSVGSLSGFSLLRRRTPAPRRVNYA